MSIVTKKTELKERVLLVGLYGPDLPREIAKEHLDELEQLTQTAGGFTVGKILQNRTQADPGTYIGKGKLSELSSIVGSSHIDLVIFDDDLTPTQVRNIQRNTNAKILDRSGLILDIFAYRAKTSAAKTQVEMAQLQYLLPRLTRAWTHLSRQKGGIGTKGPGETQIETDRRLIGKQIATLKSKLEKLERQRTTQRKGRNGMTRIALVGYTNAGKSTLMNALTSTNVIAEDRLFATLDSTVRKLSIDNKEVLISDTVGFIRKLPFNLIESFKSTLDEIRESDILLHIVDASSTVVDDYIDVVQKTLSEIGVQAKPVILVFNKVDNIKDPLVITALKRVYPDAVWISASRHIGLNNLEEKILGVMKQDLIRMSLEIPVQEYKAVSFIHDVAEVEKEEYKDEIVKISFGIHERYLGELKSFIKKNDLETSIAC